MQDDLQARRHRNSKNKRKKVQAYHKQPINSPSNIRHRVTYCLPWINSDFQTILRTKTHPNPDLGYFLCHQEQLPWDEGWKSWRYSSNDFSFWG